MPKLGMWIGDMNDAAHLEQLKANWAKWLAGVTPNTRRLIEHYGLNPWDKYALDSRPDRAMFFRISRFNGCLRDVNHLHLALAGFTHDGDPMCEVDPVDPDELIPYPYSDANPTPAEVVALEMEVLRRIKQIEDATPDLTPEDVRMIEVQLGSLDDPTADPLRVDDPKRREH